MTGLDWDYHLEVAEKLQTEISDNQLYFIIRHPWRYSKELVNEAELIVESVMGIGAADFIRELSDEEVYVGGT
ncbi:MAG: hypothetical protein J6Y02_02215 [Pseudobutyrivibrio sp.]|nr:hypothetical protein [Pseudobutyrivibrio sp.]